MQSHFCTSLVIQPPAGAWDVQLAPLQVCWAVPSGPEPATRPELRAAKVLWIVGVGSSPDSRGMLAIMMALHLCLAGDPLQPVQSPSLHSYKSLLGAQLIQEKGGMS